MQNRKLAFNTTDLLYFGTGNIADINLKQIRMNLFKKQVEQVVSKLNSDALETLISYAEVELRERDLNKAL